MRDDFDAKWNQLAQEVMSGMTHRPTPAWEPGTWAGVAAATSQGDIA